MYMYILYYKPTCPFCQKVLMYAEKNGVEFTLKNIEEEENAENLIALGGKRQVPFLVNDEDETKLYESDDIIAYLERQSENS